MMNHLIQQLKYNSIHCDWFPTDVTAVCILEGFQNQSTLQMADRVLKALGKEKAKEELKVAI